MEAGTPRAKPLQIDEVPVLPYMGVIGICLCPGHSGRPDLIDRDLHTDLDAIQGWGADAIVTLMEDHEFIAIRVPEFPHSVQRVGLPWYHLPIRDTDVPNAAFEERWCEVGPELIDRLKMGQKVLMHCRGGIGRSGTIAAKLLIEMGHVPENALTIVRANRRGAVENAIQESYVLSVAQQNEKASI